MTTSMPSPYSTLPTPSTQNSARSTPQPITNIVGAETLVEPVYGRFTPQQGNITEVIYGGSARENPYTMNSMRKGPPSLPGSVDGSLSDTPIRPPRTRIGINGANQIYAENKTFAQNFNVTQNSLNSMNPQSHYGQLKPKNRANAILQQLRGDDGAFSESDMSVNDFPMPRLPVPPQRSSSNVLNQQGKKFYISYKFFWGV